MENNKAKIFFQYNDYKNDPNAYNFEYWGFSGLGDPSIFRRNYPSYLILNVKDYV